MKNTLQDLNNHLFEQLERLNDEDLTDEELDRELKRAEGMTKIATQIIENGELAFKTRTGKYVCSICGYVYDPAEHDNVAFDDLPEDWKCPRCKQPKGRFNRA